MLNYEIRPHSYVMTDFLQPAVTDLEAPQAPDGGGTNCNTQDIEATLFYLIHRYTSFFEDIEKFMLHFYLFFI